MATYAQARLAIIQPSMEWALYAFLSDDFPSDPKVGTQVCAVRVQGK